MLTRRATSIAAIAVFLSATGLPMPSTGPSSVVGAAPASAAVTPSDCTNDPSRTILASGRRAPCDVFNGDQARCEAAYYVNARDEPISCAYVDGSCVGCGGLNGICPGNTCAGEDFHVFDIPCYGEPERTAFLGTGGRRSERCHAFDGTSQAVCENAYYDGSGRPGYRGPVSCVWDAAFGTCGGCGGRACTLNACAPAFDPLDFPCEADPDRSTLLGIGVRNANVCRRLSVTDQETCEDAYYFHPFFDVAVGCRWDGNNCTGTAGGESQWRASFNACLADPVELSTTCPLDPGRQTLLGFGHTDDRACRVLDDTDRATCEDAYYEDVFGGFGVACWWDGNDCRGSSDDHRRLNACQLPEAEVNATCGNRSNALGFGENDTGPCRAFDGTDQATCEDAFYENNFGAAQGCVWVGADSECRACGQERSECTDDPCAIETCAGEPGRPNRIGTSSLSRVGQDDGGCRQYDGDQTTCEQSWYVSRRAGRGVACVWDGASCRGGSQRAEDDACLPEPSCPREPGRQTFAGFGANSSSPCGNYDGMQSVCEDAFYLDNRGQAVACYWGYDDQCFGSGNQHPELNACQREPAVADAICADSNRTVLLGFGRNRDGDGSGPCNSLDGMEPECNAAYYESARTYEPIACVYNSGDCQGTSTDGRESLNACFSSETTCTGDPTRQTVLGRHRGGSSLCENLSGGGEAVCEDAYYILGGRPVACWWDGARCRGSGRRYFHENQCFYDEPPRVPSATCAARSMLVGFGNVGNDDNGLRPCSILTSMGQGVCETAYYESMRNGFAIGCWWDTDTCRGSAGNYRDENVCDLGAECPEDPERDLELGVGGGDRICRDLDGDQTMCERAFYVSDGSFEPVACWWSALSDECRGSGNAFGRFNSCLRPVQELTATCGDRTLIGLGHNDSGRSSGGACRQLDGDQAGCEDAYYEDHFGHQPVACVYDAIADRCMGTLRVPELNECAGPVTEPECADPSRTLFIGRGSIGLGDDGGGGACLQFNDNQGMCDLAYYVGQDGFTVSCSWIDFGGGNGLCLGTGGGSDKPVDFRRPNTCITSGVDCADGRPMLIGNGGGREYNDQRVCRRFDGMQAECEASFYVTEGGIPVSCYYDVGACIGCGRNDGDESSCPFNACVDVECTGDPGREPALTCQHFDTQGECENAWHFARIPGLVPYPASCFWNEDQDRCFGCGIRSQGRSECVNSCKEGCGNGILDPGEACDDGNRFAGDCCDPTCQLEADGSLCDDGLFCTIGEGRCEAGACVGETPRPCVSCIGNDCNESFDRCEIRRRGGPAVVGGAVTSGMFDPENDPFPLPEGTTCDDGVDGTIGECNGSGFCVGIPVTETATPTPTLDPADGTATPTATATLAPAPAPVMGGPGFVAVLVIFLGLALVALRRSSGKV